MPDKPDFIVDPSGNARDVRGQKQSSYSVASSSQTSRSRSSTSGGNIRSPQDTRRTPGGFIFIPIGLILSLIIAICRMSAGPSQKNTYPESDVNTLNLGLHYFDQGDYEKAIVQFNMAIASQPEMGEAYNDRGLAYYAIGETDKAIADFNKAIELLPNPAISYSNRGGLYLFQGNYEQALADLDKAIELSPRLAKAYHNRGLTYLDMGNYDQAIADFDQAIELTPELMFSIQATKESRNPTGESLLGSDFYTGLMNRETYADLPMAYASRAMAYLQKGDPKRAARDLKKATQLGLDPDFAQQVEALLAVSTTLGPQPVSTLVPRAGHWEGSSNPGGNSGPVSFDIGADGQIHNFKLNLVFGPDNYCLVDSQDVFWEADGTFSFTFDPYGMGNGILTQGKFVSSTLINGSFSGTISCILPKATHLNGGQSQGDSWSAQWVSGPGGTPVSSENQASEFPSDFLDAYGVVMINVPAETFTMGNDDTNSYDRPVHSVYLDAYAVDKYEVTNKLYKDCVDAGVCKPLVWVSSDTRPNYYGNPEFDEYPVVNVDWDMAKTYCEWRGARLPTEAEWEKAARGTDGRTYPWGNEAPNKDLLNYNQEVGNSTKVGCYEAGRSFYGAYDMAGNVAEWVNDWYGEAYYQNSPPSNPLGPDSGQYRVLRGGSWANLGSDVRSAYRERYDPSSPNYLVGIRCASSLH